jgi:pimeloyl-ACP methyl ester carboxylesterase
MSGTWTTIELGGKPVDAFDPPDKPRFGVIYLHPYGLEMIRDNPAFTAPLAELRLACLAPHGQRSWWADRVCPEFDLTISAEQHLLRFVVPHFEQRWGLRSRGVGVFGISMGGQAALRLAFKYPEQFPAAAGISSALDYHQLYGAGLAIDEMYDSGEQCRQDTALLHIHPSRHPPHLFFCIDPDDYEWYRGNDRLVEKLNALGVVHQSDLQTRAGGHSWAYFNAVADRAIRFIAAGLEHESRRLL